MEEGWRREGEREGGGSGGLEMWDCDCAWSIHKPYSVPMYRIAGNIGGGLNLVDWRFYKHTAKFKSANYFSSTNVTSSCSLVGPITAKLISANFDFSPFLSNPPNVIPANISGCTIK